MSTRINIQFDKFLGTRLNNGVVDPIGGTISALKCENVELYKYGQAANTGIRTQRGQQDVATLEGYTIIGDWTTVQDGKEHRLIYGENEEKGTLFNYENEVFAPIIENLKKTGVANAISHAQGRYDYFIFTNGEDFWAYSFAKNPRAEEINAIDDQGRKIKGLSLVSSGGRIWIETDDRVHYSKQLDFLTWDANDFDDDGVPLKTNSGYEEGFSGKVTGIASYIESIIVFTETSSTMLQGNPMDLANYQRKDAAIGGTVSFSSFVVHDQYLFFYDRLQRSIYYFLQNDVGQRRTGEPVTLEIQPYLMDIDASRPHEIKMFSVYADGKNEIWLLLPTTDGGQKILIYNYTLREWTTRTGNKITSLNIYNNALYSTTENKIVRENLGALSKPASYKFSVINLGSNTNLKIPKLLPTVTLDESYNNEFWVRVKVDGKSKSKSKLIKARFQDILTWGDDSDDVKPNEIWDENNWTNSIEGGQRVVKLFPPPVFRWLEIEFFTQNAGEEFAIKNFEMKRVKIKEKA